MTKSERSELEPDIIVRRIQGDGVWARVSSVGDTGERPFILVAGIGVSSHYFEQLAPHLMQYGPVHALDLPGFGGVPHARHALSIGQFAELVGKAIDDLDLVDPVIVGHSMGTQICTELAAARPELTTLVLISPVIDASARGIPVQAFRFLRAGLHEPFRVQLLAVVAYLTCGFGWFFKILPRMMSYPIERAASRVRASTLVIRGEHDAVCPRPWVGQLSRTFTRAVDVVEIEGAAHSVMHAHAREVAGLCVRHANGAPTTSVDEPTVRLDRERADHASIALVPELPKQEASLSLTETATAVIDEVKGAVIEFRGARTDDDQLVELGREQQAEARARGLHRE
ncbi:alpha/beta fold hydrolase [Arthrobacter pityocampae]|uniref:alpha/beta fold hydrolase n=1 Tax=Arthrobacter pityocampae TaxID=547334 RepID=UPI00373605AC